MGAFADVRALPHASTDIARRPGSLLLKRDKTNLDTGTVTGP